MYMCVCVGGAHCSFPCGDLKAEMYMHAPSTVGPFMFYAKSKLSEEQDIVAAVEMEKQSPI